MLHLTPSRYVPFAIAVAGAALSVAAGWRQYADNEDTTQDRLHSTAGRVVVQLQERMHIYEYELRGIRGSVIGAGGASISRQRFFEYARSRDLEREFPGSIGQGFIRKVSVADQAGFEGAARRDGWPEFSIRQFASHGGDWFVIQYVEPEERNRAAIGLDIASEPMRRAAALESVRTGAPTLTAPIELVQADGVDRLGFLMLMPIYEGGLQPASEQERETAALGWAYSPLVLARVMKGFDYHEGEFTMGIVDVTDRSAPVRAFASIGHGGAADQRLVVSTPLHVFGRDWTVAVTAGPKFLASLRLPDPWLLGAGVQTLATIVAGVFYLYMASMERRRRVSIGRDRLASIVAFSEDAIIAEDMLGVVTDWNAGATRIFGYDAAEMVGQPFARLYPAVEGNGDVSTTVPRRHEVREQIDEVLVAKDGRLVDVSMTESPIGDATGKVVGMSLIVRDTTQQKKAEGLLRVSERRFRDLAESLPHMVWTCNGDGSCDYLSPQWVAYTGIPEESQLGYRWLEQLHPNDVEPTKERWGAAAAAAGTFDTEFRIRRHDGAYRWFKTRAVPIRDATGRVAKWFGSNTDIQEVRDAQDAAARLNLELETRVLMRTEELRTANTQLMFVAKQLEAAQRIAQVGSGEFEVATARSTWSVELFRIMGLDPSRAAPSLKEQKALFARESWARMAAAVARSLATGEPCEEKLVMVRPDGAIRTVIARGEVVPGAASGKYERLAGTFHDVTEQERVSASLQQLTERLQLATSAARMGVWDWSVPENDLVWDETMHELYGTSSQHFTGAYDIWRNAVHPDDRAETEALLNDAVLGLRDYNTTFRIAHSSGEIRYLRAAAKVHRDATGAAIRMVGVNWDITEQRAAELALRSSEALQRGILAHAGSAIIATDKEGTITLWNRAAEELLGYEAAEVVGVATPALIHDAAEVESRRTVLESELGAAITPPFEVLVIKSRSGKPDANEWTYLRKDRSPVPVLLTVTTLRDGAGEIFGYLGIAADLTNRKEQENQLRTLNRLLEERSLQAESASQAKSMFLANMSHEIRTPMGAITGVTYLLARTELSAEQRGLVRTIERSTKTLLGMINDVLDLSKIEAQQLTLDIAPFQLSTLLDEVAGLMTAYATGKSLNLVVHSEPDLPDHLIGDRVRLVQILTNLAGNAVKFTDTGSVRLEVRCVAQDAAQASLRFDVIDSGLGMDEDLLSKLFTPFTQAARGARRVGGTGLGLAIVKQLVTLMGGEVGVRSAVGAGSQFWCILPFQRGASELEVEGSRLRVLVVDHDEEERGSLVATAKRLGWQVEATGAGEQALSLILDRVHGAQRFEAVILDCKMPGMDGLQALAAMRGALGADAPRPAAILTASTDDLATVWEDTASRLADAILSKPITASTLLDAVAKGVSARTGSVERVTIAIPYAQFGRRLPGARILVVDDNDINRDIASRILGFEGAEVQVACNGREAVELVTSAQHRFDAVLMDIQMPEVDGIEATRQIRKHANLADLPIIALTAGALASERQSALGAGMNDFISKPFDPEKLIASVRRHVERARGVPLGIVSHSEPRHAASDWPAIVGVDADDAYLRFNGDVDLFRTLLTRFLQELDDVQRSVSLPVDEGSWSDLGACMHKVRGTAGNLGARALSRVAGEAETALRGKNRTAINVSVRQLLNEMDLLNRSIREVVQPPAKDSKAADDSLGSLDTNDLATFMQHLQQQDLNALSIFAKLSRAIEQRLGTAKHTRLGAALDVLDFATAVGLVAGLEETAKQETLAKK